jgi:hypothetical protein
MSRHKKPSPPPVPTPVPTPTPEPTPVPPSPPTPGPLPILGKRLIPIGLYNVNNQPMNSPNYVYGIRFVLDHDTTLSRFLSGFNLEGSEQLGGRVGYSHGSAGINNARLCECKPDGTPDLSRILAEETISLWQRYLESKIDYGISSEKKTQLLFFKMSGVKLKAGVPYVMTYRNVDPNASVNWFSENSPTCKETVAGPNGVNTLDPFKVGAIAGLDPREAVCWSQDGGKTWSWGRHAGEGNLSGNYGGSATGDDGTRLPWYGWQEPSTSPQSNQPYYAYKEQGSYTMTSGPAPKAVTLTEAGGYAPVGLSPGIITVKNLTSGVSGKTMQLGTGFVRGTLDKGVPVAIGDRLQLANTGTVIKAEGDSFIVSTLRIGTGRWSFQTAGFEMDMAQMFALPWPWL